jgi:hypothetical protein
MKRKRSKKKKKRKRRKKKTRKRKYNVLTKQTPLPSSPIMSSPTPSLSLCILLASPDVPPKNPPGVQTSPKKGKRASG